MLIHSLSSSCEVLFCLQSKFISSVRIVLVPSSNLAQLSGNEFVYLCLYLCFAQQLIMALLKKLLILSILILIVALLWHYANHVDTEGTYVAYASLFAIRIFSCRVLQRKEDYPDRCITWYWKESSYPAFKTGSKVCFIAVACATGAS